MRTTAARPPSAATATSTSASIWQDLKAYAEQGNLDIYVAINLGNPGTGEYNLPDEVDTGTSLKWQVVVASYQTDKGNVYVWDKNHPTHSTAIGQDLAQFGVTDSRPEFAQRL